MIVLEPFSSTVTKKAKQDAWEKQRWCEQTVPRLSGTFYGPILVALHPVCFSPLKCASALAQGEQERPLTQQIIVSVLMTSQTFRKQGAPSWRSGGVMFYSTWRLLKRVPLRR